VHIESTNQSKLSPLIFAQGAGDVGHVDAAENKQVLYMAFCECEMSYHSKLTIMQHYV